MKRECCKCAGRGFRDVGTSGYCWYHYGQFLKSLESVSMWGIGIPLLREPIPEFQTNVYHLECSGGCQSWRGYSRNFGQQEDCRAQWIGFPGDPCPWCEDARRLLLENSHDEVLREPDLHIDLNDAERDNALAAWKQRMLVAVEAGIINEGEMNRTYGRAII